MRCFAGWSLWFVGKPDQAKDQVHEALNLAYQLREPHGLAHALFFASILHQLRREATKAQERVATGHTRGKIVLKVGDEPK